MSKETEFKHPPRGHVAVLGYDTVNDRWQVFYVDDDGHVSVDVKASALPTGAATSAKQLADGHNVTVDNPSLAVTGAFYQETQPVSVAALPLPSGAATSAKQLADGHNVTVDNPSLAVTGAFYQETQPVSIATLPTAPVEAADGDKVLSFGSIVEEAKEDLNVSVGNPTLSGTDVNAGKVWKITAIAMRCYSSTATKLEVFAVGLAGNLPLMLQANPVDQQWYHWLGEVYLQVDDYLRVQLYTATAGDYLFLRYAGVQMDAP